MSLILQIVPSHFYIEYIKGHQDDKGQHDNLTIKARLNIFAYKIMTKHASVPKTIHIVSVSLSIYIDNKYTHHKLDHNIRRHAYADEAKRFICNKYQWSTEVFGDIYWSQHSSSLNNMNETRKRHVHRSLIAYRKDVI